MPMNPRTSSSCKHSQHAIKETQVRNIRCSTDRRRVLVPGLQARWHTPSQRLIRDGRQVGPVAQRPTLVLCWSAQAACRRLSMYLVRKRWRKMSWYLVSARFETTSDSGHVTRYSSMKVWGHHDKDVG